VAEVNDKVQLGKVETWYDPLIMFRQIAPNGVVNESARTSNISSEAMDIGQDRATPGEQGVCQVIPRTAVGSQPEAVATSNSNEVKLAHEEIGKITPAECPVLMTKD
jgi:hypothetical protein